MAGFRSFRAVSEFRIFFMREGYNTRHSIEQDAWGMQYTYRVCKGKRLLPGEPG
jgi:hypothetical protein